MKKILSFTIVALFTFLLLELSCFAFFSTFQERFTFFNPAELTFDMKKIERAKRVFDAGLGWKHPYQTKFGERPRDLSFPQTWMATFGDSYTHCDQVQNNETYQHFLSKNLHMNVLNFGVGGYGTDQALLRFREAFPKVQSPVVAIGLITENINRIVNVFRKFYYPKTALSLSKPRFMLTKDQNLTLIPNPIQSSTEIEKLANPEFLATLAPYDYWYNRDQYPRLSFPYSAILLNKRLWLEVSSRSQEEAIDDTNPRPWETLWEDNEARRLLFTVLDSFVTEAKTFGSEPLLLLSPRRHEVYKSFRGEPVIERDILMAYCLEKGYRCFDGIKALTASVGSEEEIKSLYSGHLTKRGNRLFAKSLYSFLESEKLLPADLTQKPTA